MIDSVLVITAPGADLASVRAGVTDAVAGRAVVAEPTFRSAQSGGPVAIMRTLMLSAASSALVVAGFLIFNAMSMAITQRRPVISMLRAIGAKQRQIVRDLLVEAGLVGLVGGAAGIGARRAGRQAGDRPAARGVAAGIRVANRIHPAPLRDSGRRDRVRRRQRCGGGAGGPPGVQGAAGRSPGARRRRPRPMPSRCGRGWWLVSSASVSSQRRSWSPPAIWAVSRWSAVALMVLGQIALCFAFAGPIVARAAACARAFGAPGELAAATIERAPRRVWATLMTVMIAVSLTVHSTGSNANAIDSTDASFAALGDVDFFVSSSGPGVFPTAPLLPQDAESVDRVDPGSSGPSFRGRWRTRLSGAPAC